MDKRTDAGKHEKYPSLNGSPSDVLRAIHRHSPQPLRRPKPRYVDPDEEESPVKPTPAAPSMISSVRQPSLVHAAQSVRDDHEEKMIQRLSSQFPNVEQSTISSLLRKYPGNPDRAINQIHYANQMKAEQESYTSAKMQLQRDPAPYQSPLVRLHPTRNQKRRMRIQRFTQIASVTEEATIQKKNSLEAEAKTISPMARMEENDAKERTMNLMQRMRP